MSGTVPRSGGQAPSGGRIQAALADLATRFVLLPNALADALDEHGPDAQAVAWITDGRLQRLEVLPERAS